MLETRLSMRLENATVSPPSLFNSVGVGPSQRALKCAHSFSTLEKLLCTRSSQGTNNGRSGSPSRNSCKLLLNSSVSLDNSRVSPVPTASDKRYDCIRIRPASFTAAAPPSSCQETQRVAIVNSTTSSKYGKPIRDSLALRLQYLRIVIVFWT